MQFFLILRSWPKGIFSPCLHILTHSPIFSVHPHLLLPSVKPITLSRSRYPQDLLIIIYPAESSRYRASPSMEPGSCSFSPQTVYLSLNPLLCVLACVEHAPLFHSHSNHHQLGATEHAQTPSGEVMLCPALYPLNMYEL